MKQKRPERFEHFRRISTLLLEDEYSRVFEAWEAKRQEMMVVEKELAGVAVQISVVNEVLADTKLDAKLSTEALREEFELLHREGGVLLGIEINGVELHIFTKPIEHIQQNGSRSMLGQYKIVLSPVEGDKTRNANTFGAIKMAEWGWRGPFCHPEANIRNTYDGDAKAPCFGSQIVGSVHKALLDHDYKVLISLLLLYLAGDGRVPNSREKTQQDKEIYVPKQFYANEDARNQVREEYVNFVRQYRGEFRKNALQKELQEAEKNEQEKTELYGEVRKAWMLFGAKVKFLRSCIDTLPIEREFTGIHNLPSLANIMIGPDFIWAVFGPGRGVGSGAFKDIWFSGTFRVLVKPHEGLIQIWGMSLSSVAEEGFLRDRVYSGGDFKFSRHVKRLFATGLFGEALTVTHNILRGQEFEEKKMPQDEGLTKELVAEYLREHGFPDFDPPSQPQPQSQSFNEGDVWP
jgi:hypothetical protein